MKPVRLLLLIACALFIASCAGFALTRTNAPVYIELDHDLTGNLLKTRSVVIHADGAVWEERYDFSRQSVYALRYLGRLSVEQMKRIETMLEEEDFASLPEDLAEDPETGLITMTTDAAHQSIGVTRNGSTQYVSTQDVEETEQGERYDRFRRLWRGILAEVEKV